MRPLPWFGRPSNPFTLSPLFHVILLATTILVLLNTAREAASAPGINLSWDDCGTAGSEIKTFACDKNGGMPFTLVGSFKPPDGVTDMLGLSAEMGITGVSALPDWWKHGEGQCRGFMGLGTDFDFTSNTACTDWMHGRGVGGFAYDVHYGGPNLARLRLQAAIPIDDRLPLDTDTEYYAFKVQFLPNRVVDSDACAGCSTPLSIRLREIQLFQPPENAFDPSIVSTLTRTETFWQAKVALPDAPVITSFSPESGEVGTEVELHGSNLVTVTRVRFNQIEAEFTIESAQLLKTRVPSGASDGIIVVEGPGGYASTPGPFDVHAPLPPVVYSISPHAGSPGQTATITGANFNDVTFVRLGAINTNFTVNSSSSIDMTVPPTALTGRIHVITSIGTASSPQDFIVAPVLVSVQPDAGLPGSPVNLQGTNLTYVTSVKFNGVDATFQIRSPGLIVTAVPQTATTGLITVTNPGGTYTTPVVFTVLTDRSPRIDSIDPTAGPPGAEVVVRGARFENVANVRLANQDASFVVASDNTIRMTVPSNGLTGRISVTTSGGTATSPVDFIVAPAVTNFTPSQGPVGTQVDIAGRNLTHVQRVSFNGGDAPFLIVATNRILVTVPASATSGPITVVNPGGQFVTPNAFTVTATPGLRIDRFLPANGPPGTQVFVYGTKFYDVSSVALGDVPVSFVRYSHTELRMTVPSDAPSAKIRLTSYSGKFVESATAFVVTDPTSGAGGINLSWDDCGTTGVRVKQFVCDGNSGAPFTLVGSFVPPPGVTDFLGVSAEMTIESEDALPNWWKHGAGQCRGASSLAADFNFTSGPFTCADVYQGAAAGGFAYDVGFGSPNRARFRIQGAVPIDNRASLDADTEYYAFKATVLRSRTTGTAGCSGCDVPVTIALKSIQLFQPPENAFDPTLTQPIVNTNAYWQRVPDVVPSIGPNLVENPSFEGGIYGWAPLDGSTLQHVDGGRTGAFAMQAIAPDTAGEFGATDYPNVVKPVLEAGHRYRFGAWVKAVAPALRAQIRVREYLDYVRLQSETSTWVVPKPEWQYVELDVTATTAGSTLDFAVLSPSSTPFAPLLIDDVSIQQLGTAPSMTTSEDQIVDPLQQVMIDVNANDLSGQAIRELEADLSDLPTEHGATFTLDPDKKHGVVTWTPRIEDGGGTYTITFRARSLLEHTVSTRITVRAAANPYGLSINPSFEGPRLYGWNEIHGAILSTTSPGRSGAYALHLRGSQYGTFGLNDSPNIISKKRSEELTRYRYTCWVRGVDNSGKARARIREYQDTTRVYTRYSLEIPLTTAWRKLVVEHVATAKHSTLDFAVICEGTTSGVIYVDDVAVFGFPTAGEAERAEDVLASQIALAPPRVVPNPVRERAMLEMTLARRGDLKVELFDVNGRRVRNVFQHDDAEAGLHQFDIGAGSGRANRLGPGVFFYRIENAGVVKKGRFVVLE